MASASSEPSLPESTDPLQPRGSWGVLARIRPTLAVDSVAFVRQERSRTVEAEDGERCAKATEKTRCLGAFEAAVSSHPAGGLKSCSHPFLICHQYLVATSGDDVVVIDTLERLNQWLGPIDSPTEARLVALAHGYEVSFGADVETEVGANHDAVGYVFQAGIWQSCPIMTKPYLVRVTPKGELQQLEALKVDKPPRPANTEGAEGPCI